MNYNSQVTSQHKFYCTEEFWTWKNVCFFFFLFFGRQSWHYLCVPFREGTPWPFCVCVKRERVIIQNPKSLNTSEHIGHSQNVKQLLKACSIRGTDMHRDLVLIILQTELGRDITFFHLIDPQGTQLNSSLM